MNNYNPQFGGPGGGDRGPPRSGNRGSADFRGGMPGGANGNGPVAVPPGAARGANGHGMRNNAGGFDGPKSPASNKNTSHVPCKFFRQGTCQAGNSCPFMHSNETTTEILPCKYFAKGNCKFGAKCALAHILPNGQPVNRSHHMRGPMIGPRMYNQRNMNSDNASLLSMQTQQGPPGAMGFGNHDEYFQGQGLGGIPTIDTTFNDSNYGSPPNDHRLGVSPAHRQGLSVMDAPLPASFDSQGISHIARYGEIASSVPARFGNDDLPSPSARIADSHTLRNLHSSAFGDEARGADTSFTSAPSARQEDGGRRIMHSERFSRPNMYSASLGARPPMGLAKDEDDWESNFPFEEDYVPSDLGVLTPNEKMRRFSRTDEDNSARRNLSGYGTPNESSSKVGSPKVGSPSRYSGLWRQQQHDVGSPGGSTFGHVGSPLRNSSLHPDASPSLRALKQSSGDVSPFVASPPRTTSMGMLSQQLRRTNLGSRATSNPNVNDHDSSTLHPGIARATSGSSVGSVGPGARTSLDRALSSNSITRVDEEQGVFRMEDDEENPHNNTTSANNEKRSSGVTPTSATATGIPNKRFSGGYGAFSSAGRKDPSAGVFGTSPGSAGSSPTSGGLGAIGGHRSTSGGSGGNGGGSGTPWNN